MQWKTVIVLQKNSADRLLDSSSLFSKWRFDAQAQTGRLDFLDYCDKKSLFAEDLKDYFYWEDEYKRCREGPNEWFRICYDDLQQVLSEYIPCKSWSILEIGCGLSKLSEDMWRDGYCHMTAIDYSTTAIQKRQRDCMMTPGLEFDVMDAAELLYEQDTFQCVIDKMLFSCSAFRRRWNACLWVVESSFW